MHWRNNSEHPDERTMCLCEHSYGYYDVLKAGCSGWLDLDFGGYDDKEIAKWCPLDEIADYLNRLETNRGSTMDELTQIESRLDAAWNDLETIRNVFIENNKDDFEMQLSAFEAQEKIDTVLHYIRQIRYKEA